MKRRDALKAASLTAASGFLAPLTFAKAKPDSKFKLSLNTSTISGQKLGIEKYIDIAARAGYDCIEIWIGDIHDYLAKGGTLASLKKLLDDAKVPAIDAIGFAKWMVDDEETRKKGFQQMREEMEMLAAIGCPRIAAPSAGISAPTQIDLLKVGERYHQLIALGKETGVTPLLEFWGASQFFHFGQALMAAVAAHHRDVKILADVYHLYRGDSGFDCLTMVDGSLIEVFHVNDYPSTIPREQLQDKDRIYPGDGVAPLKQILTDLNNQSGTKILSLELFNRDYWKQDPLLVAKTGREKMQKLISTI